MSAPVLSEGGSFMQYIDYLPKTCAETENLKPYLVKSFKNGRVLEFRFDDASYEDYIRRLA